MMQPAIDIPHPLSADSETVITALETAELFSSKGDSHEAVRWLRRAAESAGEAGDDARALALSRTAADLHEALEAKPPPPSVRNGRPPPLPPPLPSPPMASAPPLPSPPMASAPPLPSPPMASAPPLSSPPAVSAQAASLPPPSVRPAPTPSAPPVSPRVSYPPPPSSRPGFHPPPSHPAQAVPPAAATATASATASGERHASRVSITRSPTQHAVFEMRLLAADEPAPAGGNEGFLVMLDRNSTLLSS